MTEIPEHLLKRAQAARERAKASGEDAPAEPAAESAGAASAPTSAAASKIPPHLLERSKAARDRGAGAGAAPTPAAPAAGGGGGAVTVADAPPLATGPGGHTQRLLTVVKSGSIQDVKLTPSDKVHTWPHLLSVEFVACLAVLAFTLIFSIFVNAPLYELANFNETPNPSKAPWYFMGLQELLALLHPMVAGVTLPGLALFLLILAPYIDRNPSNKPEDRKFAVAIMTLHLMFWAVLTIIGSFFRGPGFFFVWPWQDGIFFHL